MFLNVPYAVPMSQQNTGTTRNNDKPAPEADWERVGKTLRRFRIMRGLTQDQLSTLMGFKSHSALANIEAGRKPLTGINLARAAEALGIEQIEIMRPRLEVVAA